MALLMCRCSLLRVSVVCVCMLLWHVVLAQSPYINRVYEYRPAPGQFVNLIPEYAEGDTEESMCSKAEVLLCSADSGSITLGGWGGYVVFGFDHSVKNVPGEYDFRILGNAFYSDKNDPSKGGSSEPGIVWVSRDDNENGIPDDEWYELAGSECSSSTKNYQLTYFRTPADHIRTPKPSEDLVDTTYILWRDQNGNRGYISQNRYHLQDYYPRWINAERMTFAGTLLPPNAVAYSEDGMTKYVMTIYAYGYADNHPNDSEGSKMNIEWAVNNRGNKVNLNEIDFIKVQTGVNQQCGWIGETSTEVSGAVDLHPNAVITGCDDISKEVTEKTLLDGQLLIRQKGWVYNILGNKIIQK